MGCLCPPILPIHSGIHGNEPERVGTSGNAWNTRPTRCVNCWRWMSPRQRAKVTTTREGVAPIFSASVSHLGVALAEFLYASRVRVRAY